MTDQEILDALVWAVEAIEEDRKTDALDYVKQVRDEYETRQEMANEAMTDAVYADAEALGEEQELEGALNDKIIKWGF
jgi:hypothetical protein